MVLAPLRVADLNYDYVLMNSFFHIHYGMDVNFICISTNIHRFFLRFIKTNTYGLSEINTAPNNDIKID
jgi:hypothetical protein